MELIFSGEGVEASDASLQPEGAETGRAREGELHVQNSRGWVLGAEAEKLPGGHPRYRPRGTFQNNERHYVPYFNFFITRVLTIKGRHKFVVLCNNLIFWVKTYMYIFCKDKLRSKFDT